MTFTNRRANITASKPPAGDPPANHPVAADPTPPQPTEDASPAPQPPAGAAIGPHPGAAAAPHPPAGAAPAPQPPAAPDPMGGEAARLQALARYDLTTLASHDSLDRVVRVACHALGVPLSAVSLIDSERQWFKATVGLPLGPAPRAAGMCGHTIQGDGPLVVPDLAADPRFAHLACVTGAPHLRAYLGVPLSTQDGFNIGALCVVDQRTRPDFSAGHAQVLQDLARIIVDGIELRLISQLDAMTGAVSRPFFHSETTREAARANRYGRPLSLIMLDIDHFKVVNDSHGHGAGDEVLVQLVARLHGQLRAHDLVGRLGGEEFAILLPETTMDQATGVARRLRRFVGEQPFATRAGPVPVTVSQGVVSYLTCIPDVEAILERADFELYRAKQAGRDRVCIAYEQSAGGWSTLGALH